MGNFFHFTKPNRLCLCSALVAFSVTSFSTPCYSQINFGINDVAFAFRIEQLLEKVKKAANKNEGNKLMDLMLEVKREVEIYSGISIDLSKQLREVESEIKKKEVNFQKMHLKH